MKKQITVIELFDDCQGEKQWLQWNENKREWKYYHTPNVGDDTIERNITPQDEQTILETFNLNELLGKIRVEKKSPEILEALKLEQDK